MKFFTTALCLLSIVVNSAAAFSGGMLFCKHETGDSHVVSKAAHYSESHVDNCHGAAGEYPLEHGHADSCNSCIDTEIESKADLDKAPPGSDRSLVKSPAAVFSVALDNALEIPTPRLIAGLHPARAPPISEYTVAVHIETTVLRV